MLEGGEEGGVGSDFVHDEGGDEIVVHAYDGAKEGKGAMSD